MTETKLEKARRRFMGCEHVLSREHTMQPILDALDENDALRARVAELEAAIDDLAERFVEQRTRAEKAEAERDAARLEILWARR